MFYLVRVGLLEHIRDKIADSVDGEVLVTHFQVVWGEFGVRAVTG